MKNNIFSSLSQKIKERKAGKKPVSVSTESTEQKEKIIMEEKKPIQPQVEEKTTETVKEETTEPKKEVVVDENKTEKVVEPKKEVVEETQPTEEQPQVQETAPTGNGVPLDQVATKDYVKELFESFSAKYEALINENKALKDELAENKGKVSEMQEKYENKDFGGFAKQGVQTKDKNANETFEEYSKNYI